MPTFATLQLRTSQVPDSRGRPTVRVEAQLGSQVARGDVPAGASKGRDEARTVAPEAACRNVEGALLRVLQGLTGDPHAEETLLRADAAMAGAAGDNFATLGANAVLPTSRALWQLAATVRGIPLWQLLRRAYGGRPAARRPLCLFNVFNGGLHALRQNEVLGRDRIDVQEIMVVPLGCSAADALARADAIDCVLQRRLQQVYGTAAVSRGDEAGLSVAGLGDSQRALDHVVAAIDEAGFRPGQDVALALDVAASALKGTDGYRVMGALLSSAQMSDFVLSLVKRHPGCFVSVEDGLDEDDWQAWPQLTAALTAVGCKSIGDDLFVTQLPRLEVGLACSAADAILIKVNQNGTISGTLDIVRRAEQAGVEAVISHRSGETLDDSIADLAVAVGAFGLKAGAPQPPQLFVDPTLWVRRSKYVRLAAIEASAMSM